ncbi:AP2 domain-containing protein [uncultured Paraglaciecola sp.]|uniref:AP2 domain-containing protein n=1 Tax=uncultured Paraglaciecola sp. TaxID=1765024 RepID=UPI00263030EF|nr:AP2 domain-containing protein [uncultured Paraglaciecola sp.]
MTELDFSPESNKYPYRHGKVKTRIYYCWHNMKTRCDNSKCDSYPTHGAKGISYDPRWSDFAEFYKDMGMPPSDTHTLDRIDGSGNYEKDNCRWATSSQQAMNRGLNRNAKIPFKGVTYEPKKSLYRARITVNGKTKSLGRSKDAVEAAKLYDQAVKIYHGEHGVTNKDLGLFQASATGDKAK